MIYDIKRAYGYYYDLKEVRNVVFGEDSREVHFETRMDALIIENDEVNGCFFKSMSKVREGNTISLNAETIGCGGGKFYTGFTDMPEHVPTFVSLKERYKQTPEMVKSFIEQLGVPRAEKEFIYPSYFSMSFISR